MLIKLWIGRGRYVISCKSQLISPDWEYQQVQKFLLGKTDGIIRKVLYRALKWYKLLEYTYNINEDTELYIRHNYGISQVIRQLLTRWNHPVKILIHVDKLFISLI